MSVHVNIDNFREAETARMFEDFLSLSGGVNQWFHYRAPTPVESQPVIRMNRDTLYSTTLVDRLDGSPTFASISEHGGPMTMDRTIAGDHR